MSKIQQKSFTNSKDNHKDSSTSKTSAPNHDFQTQNNLIIFYPTMTKDDAKFSVGTIDGMYKLLSKLKTTVVEILQ